MISETAIQEAIRRAGSQSALARLLGKRPSVVQYWASRGKVAAEAVLQVEAHTGVSRHDLRPDLYPREAA